MVVEGGAPQPREGNQDPPVLISRLKGSCLTPPKMLTWLLAGLAGLVTRPWAEAPEPGTASGI